MDLNFSNFSTSQPLSLTIHTNACMGEPNQVNYLEHVQAYITVKASRRGDVNIFLVSPMNTTWVALTQDIIINEADNW